MCKSFGEGCGEGLFQKSFPNKKIQHFWERHRLYHSFSAISRERWWRICVTEKEIDAEMGKDRWESCMMGMGKDGNVKLHKEEDAKLWEVTKSVDYNCHFG